jgi:hypothetical protein
MPRSGEERSRFFEKKRRKKLLLRWSRDFAAPLAEIKRSLLLLFLQKKQHFLICRRG